MIVYLPTEHVVTMGIFHVHPAPLRPAKFLALNSPKGASLCAYLPNLNWSHQRLEGRLSIHRIKRKCKIGPQGNLSRVKKIQCWAISLVPRHTNLRKKYSKRRHANTTLIETSWNRNFAYLNERAAKYLKKAHLIVHLCSRRHKKKRIRPKIRDLWSIRNRKRGNRLNASHLC